MYVHSIYQPFVSIKVGNLTFGTLVHHNDGCFAKMELFSMLEDNRHMFSQVMRFEGAKLDEFNAANAIRNDIVMPLLVVNNNPHRCATLFSPNMYFGTRESADQDAPETVFTENELNSYICNNENMSETASLVAEKYIHRHYARSAGAVLTNAFDDNNDVYLIYSHCLSDFLDEAELEMKEYIRRWNGKKVLSAA